MTEQSKLSNLNEAMLINSGKIETTEKLSRSIVDFQISKGNIMSHLPSQKILKKHNTVLGRNYGIALFRDGGLRPQGFRRQIARSSVRNCMA